MNPKIFVGAAVAGLAAILGGILLVGPSMEVVSSENSSETPAVIQTKPIEIELAGKGKIKTGPPTLTRFEKARIMGARALQLSLGAPPFIEIPKTARTSLDIAMEELEQRVIPITIRRTLPNGDFQNIPIDFFN